VQVSYLRPRALESNATPRNAWKKPRRLMWPSDAFCQSGAVLCPAPCKLGPAQRYPAIRMELENLDAWWLARGLPLEGLPMAAHTVAAP
jgi:hypothetical protein